MRYIESKITSSYISENYPKAIEYIDRSGKINLIFRICKLATL